MHTPDPFHIQIDGQSSPTPWICDACSQLCGPSQRCACCRFIAAPLPAEPTCGTVGGSITARPPALRATPLPPPKPAPPVADPAAEIIVSIYEHLGLDSSLLPAYETVPDGACVTCHTVPRYSGTQCFYCATLASLKIKAALGPLPPPPARRSVALPLSTAIFAVLAFYSVLVLLGILS